MKSIRLAALALLPLLLAACGHHHHSTDLHFDNDAGAISFDQTTVVISPRQLDKARVSTDGSLEIGGRPVTLSAQGRAALAYYNALGIAFSNQALQLGVQAAHFALDSIGDLFLGLLHGRAQEAGREVEQGGQRIKQKALGLCQGLRDWRDAQDAAVQAVPEFRPYAVITAGDVDHDCQQHDEDSKPQPARDQQAT